MVLFPPERLSLKWTRVQPGPAQHGERLLPKLSPAVSKLNLCPVQKVYWKWEALCDCLPLYFWWEVCLLGLILKAARAYCICIVFYFSSSYSVPKSISFWGGLNMLKNYQNVAYILLGLVNFLFCFVFNFMKVNHFAWRSTHSWLIQHVISMKFQMDDSLVWLAWIGYKDYGLTLKIVYIKSKNL